MLMRCATTSPVSDPSPRMSTRSLAVMLPRTLPSTTISRAEMLAATTPLRPTVTRLPGRLMEPSTRPSIYSDSEPVTSPLMTSDLPSVACSWVLSDELDGRGGMTGSAGGVKERGGGSGVGVGAEVGVFVGFHMIDSKSFLHGSLGEAPVVP